MKILELLARLFGKIQLAFAIPLGTLSKPNVKTPTPAPTASGDPLPPLAPLSEPETPIPVSDSPTNLPQIHQHFDKKSFVVLMMQIADDVRRTHGIFQLITITQAAHESNWGNSRLAKEGNNLFGITGDSWAELKRPVIYFLTTEYIKGKKIDVKRPFRKYGSWLFSTQDWANSIANNNRYRTAYECSRKGDLKGFATEVTKAGYATDPKYADKLLMVGSVVMEIIQDVSNV